MEKKREKGLVLKKKSFVKHTWPVSVSSLDWLKTKDSKTYFLFRNCMEKLLNGTKTPSSSEPKATHIVHF